MIVNSQFDSRKSVNNIKLFVTDETGKIIYNKKHNQINEIKFNIPDKRGVYFAIIKYNNAQETLKLFIE